MKQFVIVAIAGSLVVSGTLAGQSRDELRRKYGEPVSQTFTVRPDVTATATYAADGRVTELLISPKTPDLIKSRGKTLSADAIKEVIDELVPLSARGKYLIGGFLNLRCLPEDDCEGTSTSYEQLTIYYNAAAEGRLHYAVVQWKQ